LKEQRKITRSARAKFGMKYISLYTQLYRYGRVHGDRLFKEGRYYFHYRTNTENGTPVLYYKSHLDDEDSIAYNPNHDFKKTNYIIQGFTVSNDGRYLVVSLSKGGSDWREIRVRDLHQRKDLPDIIQWAKFSNLVWFDNGFFYSRFNDLSEEEKQVASNKGQKLCYHKLGSPQSEDNVIYTVSDAANSPMHFELTSNGRYLIIYSVVQISGKWCNVVSYKDMSGGIYSEDNLLIATPRKDEVAYNVIDCINDRFVVMTNLGAPNYKVISFHKDSINWAEPLIPQYTETLKSVYHIDHKLFCLYFDKGVFKAVAFDYAGVAISTMNFDLGTTVSGFSGSPDDSVVLFYQNSFYYPMVVMKLNLQSNKADVLHSTKVYYDADRYTTEIVNYRGKDGTEIPMYLTYKKGLKVKNNNPVLLYGYGGFGISVNPFYDYGNIIFFESGGIFAAPLIRGGGEFGKNWHDAGKGLQKQNSFDDFAAAAEYLTKNNYTSQGKLVIKGGSNGGLLVGAMLTQNPTLFIAAVGEMGAYDMLRYHLFTGGRFLEDEYGTVKDSVQFLNLNSYSPYQNLKQGTSYPATFIRTAANDERVPPFHSYKFLAALQEKSAGTKPHILHFQEDAGHTGSITFDAYVEEDALVWAFIYKQLGMDPTLGF
ncbi:MAG TPA: prolyl oligopeptidase family serine peptidase, partial [Chitinophagales bacterium]|nr:prolyl oligopeptidase family serine peptidase [Chitinophagales bacterium]